MKAVLAAISLAGRGASGSGAAIFWLAGGGCNCLAGGGAAIFWLVAVFAAIFWLAAALVAVVLQFVGWLVAVAQENWCRHAPMNAQIAQAVMGNCGLYNGNNNKQTKTKTTTQRGRRRGGCVYRES